MPLWKLAFLGSFPEVNRIQSTVIRQFAVTMPSVFEGEE